MPIKITDEKGNTAGSVDAIGTCTSGTLVIAGATPIAPVPPPQINAFIAINMPTPWAKLYVDPFSTSVITWEVIPQIAAVDISCDGVKYANRLDSKSKHTAVYRLGGQAVPGAGNGGAVLWARKGVGVHTFTFTAYDDNGVTIDTETRTSTLYTS